jgi:sugar lactone lactonase YvrE
MDSYCDDRSRRGKLGRAHGARARRGFTLTELAISAVIFLLAAASLTLAMSSSLLSSQAASARRALSAMIAGAEGQIVNAPSAYDALLSNSFTPPSLCAGAGVGLGTGSQSCYVVSNQSYTVTWTTTLGTDGLGTSTATASSVTLTGSTSVAGQTVSVSQLVAAPSYGYSPSMGVVRVTVSDPSSLMSGPVFLLSMANPSTVLATGVVINGVAMLRAPAAACSLASPCVLGLTSGNSYGVNGAASMVASQVAGTDAEVVLTAGRVTSENLQIRGVASAQLTLSATNTATGQTGTNPVAGSVCLYATFDDGTGTQVAPECNWANPEVISMTDYAPDPSRPSVRLALPLNTPITLSTDPLGSTASNGPGDVCPVVTNPTSTGPSTMVVWRNGAWVTGQAECTSWTWGVPTTLTVGGVTSAWENGSTSFSLSAGSVVSGTVSWSGSGNIANLFVTQGSSGSTQMVTPSGVTSTQSSGITGSLFGVAEDASGNLYEANPSTKQILKISPTGAVSVLVGSGLTQPEGVALSVDSTTLYVADYGANAIKAISLVPASYGQVSTVLAGAGNPMGVATDAYGDVFYTSLTNHCVGELDSFGDSFGCVAGGAATATHADGVATSTYFSVPIGVAVDPTGEFVYITDAGWNNVRLYDTFYNTVTTLAGSTAGTSGTAGVANGTAARFNYPEGIEVGPDGSVYVVDHTNNAVRKIEMADANHTVTVVAGVANATGVTMYHDSSAYRGWEASQPAVGFGTMSVWSTPRVAQSCALTASCVSADTTLSSSTYASVPENVNCGGSACYVNAAPYLTSPQVGGMRAVAVSGATGSTTSFTLVVTDYSGTAGSVTLTGLPGAGTLKNGGGTTLGTGAVLGSWSAGGGGVSIPMNWTEGSSQITQTWFTLTLTNATGTSSVDVALFRTAGAWQLTGYGSSIAQGGTGSVSANVTLANGGAASASPVTWSCAACGSSVVFATNPTTSESGGVATTSVTVGANAPAGTYPVTVTSNGRSGTAMLTITPVVASVSVTLSKSTTGQSSSLNATATVRDGAGGVMTGVPVAILGMQGGMVADGVYAPSGGCTTSSSGTCTVSVTIERAAPAGTYSIEALVGALTGSANLAVTPSPGSISLSSPSVSQGSSANVAVSVTDGTGAALAGQTVSFSSSVSGLSVSSSSTTDAQGLASATVSASGAVPAGSYIVVASAGSASAFLHVTVVAQVASISTTPLSIAVGGVANEVVSAYDPNNNLISGAQVGFVSLQSGITVVPLATTGAGGTVSVTVYVKPSVSAGTYTNAIRITAGAVVTYVTVSVH